MKPASFTYHDPGSIAEAVTVLAEHGDAAKVLAGGQSLVPMLALRLARFEHLVDLGRIPDLAGIEIGEHDVTLGAMVRQATAEHDTRIAANVPLLARALPHVGHFQIRNRGTVGGSTAHADPASELPAVALALDAELDIAGPAGVRTVRADAFFRSLWTTAIRDDEILVRIRYPIWTGRVGFAVEEIARRRGDFALAGVACGLAVDDGGRITKSAISLFGMASTPVRATSAESEIQGCSVDQVDLDAVAERALESTDPSDDVHTPAWYRRRVARVLIPKALRAASAEALDGP